MACASAQSRSAGAAALPRRPASAGNTRAAALSFPKENRRLRVVRQARHLTPFRVSATLGRPARTRPSIFLLPPHPAPRRRGRPGCCGNRLSASKERRQDNGLHSIQATRIGSARSLTGPARMAFPTPKASACSSIHAPVSPTQAAARSAHRSSLMNWRASKADPPPSSNVIQIRSFQSWLSPIPNCRSFAFPTEVPSERDPAVKLDKYVTNARNLASSMWRPSLANPDRRCLVPFIHFAEPHPGGRHGRRR